MLFPRGRLRWAVTAGGLTRGKTLQRRLAAKSARLAAAKSARFAAGVGGWRLRRAFAAGVVAQPAVAVSTHQLVN